MKFSYFIAYDKGGDLRNCGHTSDTPITCPEDIRALEAEIASHYGIDAKLIRILFWRTFEKALPVPNPLPPFAARPLSQLTEEGT